MDKPSQLDKRWAALLNSILYDSLTLSLLPLAILQLLDYNQD